MSAPVFFGAEKVWFRYPQSDWVLKGLTLEIPEGSLYMMMGSSGSGKTTLLKIFAGFLHPQKGRISVLGRELRNGTAASFRSQVGYIPQHLGLVRSLTVLENVLMGTLARNKGLAAFFGFFPKKDIEHARECLDGLGILHKAGEKVMRLSGGERQRVAIARTLMQKPRLVLADEFVSDLDARTAGEILKLIREIGERDRMTFLISMHDPHLVRDYATGMISMKEGLAVQQRMPLEALNAGDAGRTQ